VTSDRRLASIVKRCQDISGQALFQFIDDEGSRRAITSTDVNDYLRAYSDGFTAKDFRTWGASVIAFEALVGASGQLSLKEMLAEVADQLGNMPAIARKSYVHPAIIEAAQRRDAAQIDGKLPRGRIYISGAELALVKIIGSNNSDTV
jgi:DNA topoisomerase I